MHAQELLAATQVRLAQDLEEEGELERAEGYLVAAGRWQDAMDMLQAHERWEGALHVAKTHGGAQSHQQVGLSWLRIFKFCWAGVLVMSRARKRIKAHGVNTCQSLTIEFNACSACLQVAFDWAASMDPEAGAPLLARLHLLEAAVEAALAQENFAYALELASAAGDEQLAAGVHLQHAACLDRQGEPDQAERHFLLGGQPRVALRAWVQRGNWAAARRLCARFFAPGLQAVLLAEAQAAADEGDTATAEALYIKARRPDMVRQLHSRAGGSATNRASGTPPEAPQGQTRLLLPGTQDYSVSSLSSRGASSQIAAAEQAQAEGRWDDAIDLYAALTQQQAGGQDAVIEAWGVAFGIAQRRRPGRLRQLTGQLGQQLGRLGQYELAGDLLLRAKDPKARSAQAEVISRRGKRCA